MDFPRSPHTLKNNRRSLFQVQGTSELDFTMFIQVILTQYANTPMQYTFFFSADKIKRFIRKFLICVRCLLKTLIVVTF